MGKYGAARQATDDNKIRRMRFAFLLSKATHTHTHNIMLIAFPRQQRFRECALLLRHTSGVIACLRCGLFMCNSYGQTTGHQDSLEYSGTWCM